MIESDRIDRQLAVAALKKRAAGEKPTAKELAALARVEKAKEEETRWRFYRTIPQKHWLAMSGRQAKVIYEQAARYGLPIAEKEIDLTRVVRALHDFFAANKYRFVEGDGALEGEDESPGLERYRLAKAEMAELDLASRRRDLVDREALVDMLRRFFDGLRKTSEALRRRFGEEAAGVFERGRREAEAGVMAALADEADDKARSTDERDNPTGSVPIDNPGDVPLVEPPTGDAATANAPPVRRARVRRSRG